MDDDETHHHMTKKGQTTRVYGEITTLQKRKRMIRENDGDDNDNDENNGTK